ncbi:MAG: hypothetical protein NC095_06255 [Muribaculum sp.]|nr:hypothetical protein [Muribaculum sp.]
MKSDIEIQKWLYDKIKGSELEEAVRPGVLSDRGRPNGSEAEDIVIAVLANNGCGQIQTAYVNVNIYVKDQWNEERSAWERDTARLAELCDLSKFLYNLFGDGIRVSDKDSTQMVLPDGAVFQDGHTEHFINNRLFIQICND